MTDHVVEEDDVLGEPNRAKPDELVVSLSYLNLVGQMFEDLGLPQPSVERRSEALNLALLRIADPETIARIVSAAVDELPSRANSLRPNPVDPLDKVLWGLRALFGADN